MYDGLEMIKYNIRHRSQTSNLCCNSYSNEFPENGFCAHGEER